MTAGPGEPTDGWVTSPLLTDTELLVTTLCRFSGSATSHRDACPGRVNSMHPDVECRTLFFQAEAFSRGLIDLEGFGASVPEQIRVPWRGGTPIGTSHG